MQVRFVDRFGADARSENQGQAGTGVLPKSKERLRRDASAGSA